MAAVPDYDYFIDESLCEKINLVSSASGVDSSLFIEIATRANNTEENAFLCFECFRSLNVGADCNSLRSLASTSVQATISPLFFTPSST